jgi:hypothetical protein
MGMPKPKTNTGWIVREAEGWNVCRNKLSVQQSYKTSNGYAGLRKNDPTPASWHAQKQKMVES